MSRTILRPSPRSRDLSTDRELERLLAGYAKSKRPIAVNFRELVHWLPQGERATHFLHPYPGKLLAHIPHFFLANSIMSSPGDSVIDPFCGSGTVLLEALLAGRRPQGRDTNPLACLITNAKCNPILPARIERARSALLRRAEQRASPPIPDVVNIAYWFYPHVIEQLARLRAAIDEVRDSKIRTFFYAAFSACVRRVSRADPRLSVPVRLKEDQYPEGHWLRTKTNARVRSLRRQNVTHIFSGIVDNNLARMRALLKWSPSTFDEIAHCKDVRDPYGRRKHALLITSPPYIGAQKYIRASSLSLGWLGLTPSNGLRPLEDSNIGREHYPRAEVNSLQQTRLAGANRRIESLRAVNPVRAHMVASYINEMDASLQSMASSVRRDGYIVLVLGNNHVCGEEFPNNEFVAELAKSAGLDCVLELSDEIVARGLMTRRNNTSAVMLREWALVFQKRA